MLYIQDDRSAAGEAVMRAMFAARKSRLRRSAQMGRAASSPALMRSTSSTIPMPRYLIVADAEQSPPRLGAAAADDAAAYSWQPVCRALRRSAADAAAIPIEITRFCLDRQPDGAPSAAACATRWSPRSFAHALRSRHHDLYRRRRTGLARADPRLRLGCRPLGCREIVDGDDARRRSASTSPPTRPALLAANGISLAAGAA